MVKLKKALKKLAKLGAAKSAAASSSSPRAAKKEAPVKKKSGSVPGAAGAKAKKAAPPAKAAPKKAAGHDDKKKAAKKATGKKTEAPAAAVKVKKAVSPSIQPSKGGIAKKAPEAEKEPSKEAAKGKKGLPAVMEETPDGAAKSKALAKPSPEKHPEKTDKALKVKKAPKEEVFEVEAPAEEEEEGPEEVFLTDAEGRRYCRVKECDQISMVDGYCRFHYLLFWKKIQVRKKILTEGKLERYIEELTARYPDKYLEMLRKDLRSEKDFTAAITELEIDESGVDTEYEDEAQSYLEEVRGMSGEGGGGAREEEEF